MRFFIALFIVLLTSSTVLAQETYSGSAEELNWDSLLKDYNTNTIDRPVTPQEVEKAIQTIKSMQKKPKKRRWWQKKEKIQDAPPPMKEYKPFVPPPSENPLLRLPVSVYNDTVLIPDGFYLVKLIQKDKDTFLEFLRGDKTFAQIQVYKTTREFKEVKTAVSTEFKDDKLLTVIYQKGSACYEAYLFILKNK